MEIRRRWIVSPMWRQVALFVGVMFFVFVADGMLSDFVPGFLQSHLGSPFLMGVVMSTSSIAGLLLDLLFARLFRKTKVKPMMLFALLGCMLFVLILLVASRWPSVLLFVAGMVAWGLYYEFFGFSSQKFVARIAPLGQRTAVWSVLETVRAVAYALAPVVMMQSATRGSDWSLGLVAGILVTGIGILMATKLRYTAAPAETACDVTIWQEMGHWRALLSHIWPAVVMGVTLAIVDSIYWTTGTIVNDSLGHINPAGSLFLSMYMISSLFVGPILGSRMIRFGKKKKAIGLIFFSGLVLSQIMLDNNVYWYLGVVLGSSLLSALAWPLLDAVYTDLLDRMGGSSAHMVGLKNACNSIAYIVGPILGGWVAGVMGELESFAYLGWSLAAIAVFLYMFTPRKLRLPQAEIADWD